jgi:cytochrome subunit of sulfide dehydrogenase
MKKTRIMRRFSDVLLRSLLFLVPPLTGAGAPLAGDIVDLVRMCEGCHGQDGLSTQPDVPIIAGFSREGFLNTMDVFRENDRIALAFQRPGEPETVMNDIALQLSNDDVEALADYFSQRPFKAAAQSFDQKRAGRGEILHKRHCDRCHTHNGAEPVEDAAILAGQWTPYLKRQFDNILAGKRVVPRIMYRRIKRLSPADIDALLNFYASQGQAMMRAEER